MVMMYVLYNVIHGAFTNTQLYKQTMLAECLTPMLAEYLAKTDGLFTLASNVGSVLTLQCRRNPPSPPKLTNLPPSSDGSVKDAVHAEDGALGRVDDGGPEHGPKHPTVAERRGEGRGGERYVELVTLLLLLLLYTRLRAVFSLCADVAKD